MNCQTGFVKMKKLAVSALFQIGGGGVLTQKKTKKKPVATPKLANWHWFFFGFFGFLKFPNWHWFFLVFLALVLARIRNWKLVFFWFFLVFFWVFLFFFLVFLA